MGEEDEEEIEILDLNFLGLLVVKSEMFANANSEVTLSIALQLCASDLLATWSALYFDCLNIYFFCK